MKVIITGGRDLAFTFENRVLLEDAIKDSGFTITEVVSGACGIDASQADRDDQECVGGDHLGETWAFWYEDIHVRRFYAEFKRFGRSAGPIRNIEMAEYADALIALPGGRGTAGMIREAKKRGLKVYVLPVPQDPERSEGTKESSEVRP